MWALADMVQSNHSAGIDEHIASQLPPVLPGTSGETPPKNQFQILPNRWQAIDIPPASANHPIGLIEPLFRIFQQWPRQFGFTDIGQCQKIRVKRNDFHLHVAGIQFIFVLTQLRQVLAAGRSPQMSMKHQQLPVPQAILQAM